MRAAMCALALTVLACGGEPVKYVEAILARFENYKAFVESKPQGQQTADAGWRR